MKKFHQQNSVGEFLAYFSKAKWKAVKFSQSRENAPMLRRSARLHRERHEEKVFKLHPGMKFIYLFSMLAFLASITSLALMLGPQYKQALTGGLPMSEELQKAIGYLLPIIPLIGASMAAGAFIFHESYIIRDKYNSRKWHISWIKLIAGFFIMGLYIALLFYLKEAGMSIATDEEDKILAIVPIMGILECVFAIFAITGINIIWAHFKGWYLNRRVHQNRKKMYRYAYDTKRNYMIYQQRVRDYNFEKQANIIHIENSRSIENAINFVDDPSDREPEEMLEDLIQEINTNGSSN